MAYTAESLVREIARMDPEAPDYEETLRTLIGEARRVPLYVRSTGRTTAEQGSYDEGYSDGYKLALHPVERDRLRREGRLLAAKELSDRLAQITGNRATDGYTLAVEKWLTGQGIEPWMRGTEMIVFHWSAQHGRCADCGRPAAFRLAAEGEVTLCSVCAANRAADGGEEIERIEELA